jgi:hypothetical protein
MNRAPNTGEELSRGRLPSELRKFVDELKKGDQEEGKPGYEAEALHYWGEAFDQYGECQIAVDEALIDLRLRFRDIIAPEME